MGRSTTPAYRVEFETAAPIALTPMAWRVRDDGLAKGFGKPTDANLATFVEDLNASFDPGGVNEHVGQDAKATGARIVRQRDDQVVATWRASSFQLV